MSYDKLDKIYAQAIFELAEEQNIVDRVLAEFECFAHLQEQEPRLAIFLGVPLFSHEQKYDYLDKVFQAKMSQVFLNLLKKLIEKNVFYLLPKIVSIYQQLADQKAGRLRAIATTAITLSKEHISKIAAVLEDAYKQKVVIETGVDPELLGGITLQIGDLWVDASIKGNFERLRRQIMKISKQLHVA